MARVDGSETLALPRERVWALLNDPDTLGAAIPGCHGLEREEGEKHRYRTSIAVAIGAVKGVYEGTVLYADIDEPERCTIRVSGEATRGRSTARARSSCAKPAATRPRWPTGGSSRSPGRLPGSARGWRRESVGR